MRLLMLVIRYDCDDWATNFIPKWAEKLAQHVTHLDVLALEVGNTGKLPDNLTVYSMGKTAGASRAQVLKGFYRHAAQLIPQCDAIFVHMIPRYVLLAAPLAKLYRKPITLWYTHRNPSRDLKMALPLVKHVVSAVETSFPLETKKLEVLGHGIDTTFYAPAEVPKLKNPTIVHVARLQPIKNQDKLLSALTDLPSNIQASIIGAVPQDESTDYRDSLYERVDDLGLKGRVIFTGGLSVVHVRRWYRQAAVAVNLSPPGLFDKAALESMATGTPTIVSNPAFNDLLGTWQNFLNVDFPVNSTELARRINAVLNLPDETRRQMVVDLRANVTEAHSLDILLPRLVAVMKS